MQINKNVFSKIGNSITNGWDRNNQADLSALVLEFNWVSANVTSGD